MIKIERILCPTGLTPESDESLRYAVALAREYKAKLSLCYCIVPSEHSNGEASGGRSDLFRRRFEEALYSHLGLTDLSQLEWEGRIVENEDAGLAITHEAASLGCDLIVMRSRRRPRRAALLGSTAEAVCRTAPCSVLVSHPQEREWVGFSAGDVDLGRVLVAHDFSDRSELALQYGLSLARKFESELHLLHVLPEPERDAPELAWTAGTAQSLYHAATGRLHTSVARVTDLRRGIRHAVSTGRPYDRILTYAGENEIDLICMGADGVDGNARALFGSNVDRVLRQAPCPVLVARMYKPLSNNSKHERSNLPAIT